MNKHLLWLAAGFLAFTSGIAQTVDPGCEDGKIYLKYKPQALKLIKVLDPDNIPVSALPGLEKVQGTYGITHVNKPYYQAIESKDLQRVFKVEFSNAQMVETLIRDLASNPLVEYAEKIPLNLIDYTPNDPSLGTQWHLTKINATNAWNVFNGNSNITVAVVDNAIQRTHTDLVANIWTNPGEIPSNAIDDDGNGYVDDVNGYDVGDNDNNVLPANSTWNHGTHTSGIVGARTDNGVGISAIGFNVKIIPVKATANSAGSNAVSNGYGGIVYAARNKARVISCSWGGTVAAATDQSVIDYAWNRGCIVVASAGNDGNQVLHYPAAYNNVYSVASSQSSDVKSGFSCYGTWVDIIAPGDPIYSTVPNNSYANMSGTSMSCPLVAGLAGLILSKNPYMSPASVLNCISSTAANIYTISGNSAYAGKLGAGRIDAYQAMLCAASATANAPLTDFYSDIQSTCPGNNISFFDLSYFNPTSWSWTFQGGTPATSTSSNPIVSWAAPGTYSVALTTSNAFGNNTKTKIGYITITSPGALPLVEGFQGAAWPPAGWTIDDKFQDSIKWTRQTTTGGFSLSTASALFDNYYNDAGGARDQLLTPKYNCASVANARLKFDIAYSRYDATYSDTLEVLVSNNCGNTWSSIYMKGGTALSTAPDYTVDIFVPTPTQWRRDSIDVSALIAGQSNIMFSFRNHGHYGQGLYLDNVNLSYTLAAAATPTANFSPPVSVCSGATVTFTDSSTGSPTAWNWVLPGSSSPTTTLQNPVVSYSTSGTYNATLTVSNATGTNTIVKSVTVNATPSLTTTVSSSSICAGTSATLTASGATSYTWTPGGTGSSIVVTPSVNTTYTVKGASGTCTSSITRSLSVSPNPTVNVNSATICSGSTATLTATGATSYSWNSGQTTAIINPSPASTTVYTVTGTTGICSVNKTSTVTVNPSPTLAVTAATICSGSSATLTASGAASYSWNAGVGASIVVSPTTNTTYTVTGFSGSCADTETTSVMVNSTPGVTLSAAQTTMCTSGTGGTTVALSGSPSGGAYSGTGVTGSTFNAQASAGTYSVVYTYTDIVSGCSNSANTNIVVSVCSGLSELKLNDGLLHVYPNPNNGIFTVTLNSDEPFDIMIYNNIGQLVANNKSVKTTTDIDLSVFGRGIYNVLVKVGTDYKAIKVIIE